jgi:hypothetical protein
MGFLRRRESPPENSWTVVAYATSLTEAEIIAGLLRTAEIPCHVQQDGMARAIGLTIGLGAIRVLVPTKFEEEALFLLEEDDPSSIIDEPAIQFPDDDEDIPPDESAI